MPPRIPLPRPARLPLRSVSRTTRRTLIAAPKATSGPLLERRADRALPTLPTRWGWLKTLPIFAGVVGASCLAIFNYQKQSSSVTTSTLYALRTNDEAREILGDEIYFRDRMPWISGELNQLHGRIDISFGVKGTKRGAVMRFRSVRRTRTGFFETLEWSLTSEDGQVVQLFKPEGPDPFKKITSRDDEDKYTH